MGSPMATKRRRSKKHSGRRARSKSQFDSLHTVPYITRQVPVYELASEELLELVENNAETVLEEIGIEFRDDPQALGLFQSAGCIVKEERVRFPRGMCREIIQNNAPSEFMQHMIVFALACFVGFQVIWNVSHSLHTPLMAVTNAISSIIIIGALLQMKTNNDI